MLEAIEIKEARNGSKIPIVNGVHLHSAYNPEGEATKFASKYEIQLQGNTNVLILGLGLGYHVSAIRDEIKKIHKTYDIRVIEPSYDIFLAYQDLVKDQIGRIYAGQTAQHLFGDVGLIHFLIKKPIIVAHPSSFNLHRKYFEEFLTFKAARNTKSLLPIVQNEKLKAILKESEDYENIESFIRNKILSQSELKNKFDHSFLAYENLVGGDL